MHPSQIARMAVLEHLLREHEDLSKSNVSISLISLKENDGDWQATLTTSAHTDKNYLVSYNKAQGNTVLNVYERTQEIRMWDRPSEDQAPAAPTTEYFGA
jgi:hypothetical protein